MSEEKINRLKRLLIEQKILEKEIAQAKKDLMKDMIKSDLKTIEDEDVRISYVGSNAITRIDTKKLKKEFRDCYEQCIFTTGIGDRLKIQFKKER